MRYCLRTLLILLAVGPAVLWLMTLSLRWPTTNARSKRNLDMEG